MGRAVLTVVAALALTASPLPGTAADAPPPQALTALTVLPPGNSGHVSVAGEARGRATGDPAAYGEHLDDQRELYWNFEFKPGNFHAEGAPEQPKPGVRIYRDDYGVPAVYADSGRDVWWGVGWSAARDRLFLMDAVRRLGRGTFAELIGPSGVPADVQARTLTYSAAEYDEMFAALGPDERDSIEGYVDGVNAYLAQLRPDQYPVEYALLSSVPQPWTVHDIVAGGVLITRTVAAEGGNEFENVALLRTLQETFGREQGRAAFHDLNWYDDPKAAVTVPASEGRFRNDPTSEPERARRFDALADWALSLPPELATGPGTGAAPEPEVVAAAAQPLPDGVRAAVLSAVDTLRAWGEGLHGGSFAVAVGPARTKDGGALLMSEPQLGYSYPTQLYEIEVHGGGYHARGTGVPGLPTVGIGYGARVAWALTSGYSKTIDSFVETTRTENGVPQYRHNGGWRDEQCRTETIRYRASVEGVPVGPPAFTHDTRVCRTVHGPVVARSDDGTLARTVQYAMWQHELDNLTGILGWNRARNFDEFRAAMRHVTWNENVLYADADGRIAYFHPGRYLDRSPNVDQRLPAPGTGEYDARGYLPFESMPHAVDPAQGYLANWNNKPAAGWVDGEGIPPTSRPAGPGQRVTSLLDQLAARRDFTFADLRTVDRVAGTRDHRWREYRPLLDLLDSSAAAELLRGYDGTAWDGSSETDSPAATLFREWVRQLRASVFRDLPEPVRERQAGVGSHVFDHSPLDNAVLRALRPASSGLRLRRNWLAGREPRGVVRAALADAVAALVERHGADPCGGRQPHPRSTICSLTRVVGPCTTMPYVDRGSWIHLVGFPPRRGAGTARPAAGVPPVRPLPATGTPFALPVAGAAVALVLRRRRRTG